MKSAYVTISAVLLVLLAATPVFARGASSFGPAGSPATAPPEVHSLNPSLSLSAPAAGNPLQAQEREDYATGLMATQRSLLQNNPSGLTRPEMGISRALNGYTGPQ
jgi:hypothetical protein